MRKQCKKCPWLKSVDPTTIPDGYDVEKHKALRSTIAVPNDPRGLLQPLRMMACHESVVGAEVMCIGWLDNQLYSGGNLKLRDRCNRGIVSTEYELRGEQHATFDDTIPAEHRDR